MVDIKLLLALFIGGLFVIFLLRSICRFFARLRYTETPFGFRGKLLSIDNKKPRGFLFFNRKAGIGASPDAVYETDFLQSTVVEIKSRRKGIYDSDWAQAEMGAVAVADSDIIPRVKYVAVSNQTETQVRPVKSTNAILRKYKSEIKMARQILNGKIIEVRRPQKNKCQACRYYDRCKDKI